MEEYEIIRLVKRLKHEQNPQLQFQAACDLTDITATERSLTDVESILTFVDLLSSSHEGVREQAVLVLGNVALWSLWCRDYATLYALRPLLQVIMDATTLSLLRNASWALSSFLRGTPRTAFELFSPALPVLSLLLSSDDEEILRNACRAISWVSEGKPVVLHALINWGVCRRLVELLFHSCFEVQFGALWSVRHIARGDTLCVKSVVEVGLVSRLMLLLSSPKWQVRKEARWTIVSIVRHPEYLQSMIEHNAIPILLDLVEDGDEEVQPEAIEAISIALIHGSDDQIKHLVSLGCMASLCHLLDEKDFSLISLGLSQLWSILESYKLNKLGDKSGSPPVVNPYIQYIKDANGVQKLEMLLDHEDDDISWESRRIFKNFFDEVGEYELEEADDW